MINRSSEISSYEQIGKKRQNELNQSKENKRKRKHDKIFERKQKNMSKHK